MLELVLAALGLGVAGIDPAGLLIAIAALAAGARGRTVVLFTLVVVAGTAAFGTVLSLTIGSRLEGFDWGSLLPPDRLAAAIELALGVALVVWGVVRLRRPEARPPRPARDRPRNGSALLLAGVVLVVTAPLDPTLLGLVVLAGRGEPVVAVGLAHLVWIVVSQLPLIVLAVAVVLGAHERVVARTTALLPRVRPVVARVATAALLLAGSFLVLDASWWVATGRFLVFDEA